MCKRTVHLSHFLLKDTGRHLLFERSKPFLYASKILIRCGGVLGGVRDVGEEALHLIYLDKNLQVRRSIHIRARGAKLVTARVSMTTVPLLMAPPASQDHGMPSDFSQMFLQTEPITHAD
jgi:hypothetical protein